MSEYGKIIDDFQSLAHAINEVTRALDDTSANSNASYLASRSQAEHHHSTPTDLSVLDNDYDIPLPDTEYQASHSPSVSLFMNAANAEYVVEGDSPKGLEPFNIDGRQAELTDLASGMSARAWQTTGDSPQVIVSFSGTGGGDTADVNPSQGVGQYLSNVPTAAGLVSVGQEDALKFTGYIAEQANERGIASDDLFVTGHSLGGAEAEYVAQQTGLGGISFSGQGIAPSDSAVGDGSNFISVVNYGDVWGSMASDVEGVQPVAADFDAEGGAHPHWGDLVMVGDVQDQEALAARMAEPGHDDAQGFLEEFQDNKQDFHYPGNQALNLGVTLDLYSEDQDAGAQQRGEVFDAADMDIAEAIAANAERSDYHDAELPDAHQTTAQFSDMLEGNDVVSGDLMDADSTSAADVIGIAEANDTGLNDMAG